MSQLKILPVLDGKSYDAASGDTVDVINPATGQIIGQQVCCAEVEVNQIVQSSQNAFGSAEWRRLGPADRGRLLLDIADRLGAVRMARRTHVRFCMGRRGVRPGRWDTDEW